MAPRRKKKKNATAARSAVINRSHPYISLLFGGRKRAQSFSTGGTKSLSSLKAEELAVQNYVLRYIRERPSLEQKWLGSLTPRTYDDFSPKILAPEAELLRDELSWYAAVLTSHHVVIQTFLQTLASFEKHILLGHLDDAALAFDSILAHTGSSLWSIEAGILLAELKGGIEDNRRFFSTIRDQTGDGFAQIIAQFASDRAESQLSVTAYRASANEFLDQITLHGHPDSLTYLRFKLLPSEYRKASDAQLKYLLSVESTYSLVDRYLILLRLFHIVLLTRPREIARTIVETSLDTLLTHFDDSRLHNLYSYLAVTPRSSEPDMVRRLSTKHLEGRYKDVMDGCNTALTSDPLKYELYELLAKAHVYSHVPLLNPFPPTSIAHDILAATHSALLRTPGSDDAVERLLKLASLFPWSRLGAQLLAFADSNSSTDHSYSATLLRELNCSEQTVRFSNTFTNDRDAVSYLTLQGGHYDTAIATTLYTRVRTGDPIEGVSELAGLPEYRRRKYAADAAIKRSDDAEALEGYKSLLHDHPSIPPLCTHALTGVFHCLLKRGDLGECASLLLAYYFTSRELLSHIPLRLLLTQFESDADEGEEAAVAWPVLYHIYYTEHDLPRDDKRLFVLVDNVLAKHGVNTPSGLATLRLPLVKPLYVYFLRHVCVPEIIDSLLAFDSTNDLEEERIAICQQLLALDPDRKADYSNEIAEITKSRSIRDALESVDTSKVFVDVPGIRRSLDRAFTERFERYRSLHGLDSRFRENVRGVRSLGGKRVETVTDVLYVDAVVDMFNALFRDLRDRYISSSDWGLDSYLSLRIRHGTLAGQLRAIFERRPLITTEDEDTHKYHRHQYWFDRLWFLNGSSQDNIDTVFGLFSKTIDDFIEEIRGTWIQIKGTGKDTGLFDFDYSDQELARVYARLGLIQELDAFVDAAFDELKTRAEHHLTRVRSAIQEALRDCFIAALDRLETDLVDCEARIRATDLTAAIGLCRADVQTELDIVASWFESVGETPFPDFDIQHLIDTAVEVMRRSNAEESMSPQITIAGNCICAGRSFTYMIDVLRILLENAVIRSHPTEKEITVSASCDTDTVHITVSNNVSDEIEEDELGRLVEELRDRLARREYGPASMQEGKSGYYKLARLSAVNLKDFDLSVVPSFAHGEPHPRFIADVFFRHLGYR